MALYNNTSEILQAVKAHFSQPDAKLSKETIANCFYRLDQAAECPTRCAIGVLIPDNLYTPDIEDAGVYDNWDWLVNNQIVPDNDDMMFFLADLQYCHDESNSVEEFLERLDTF